MKRSHRFLFVFLSITHLGDPCTPFFFLVPTTTANMATTTPLTTPSSASSSFQLPPVPGMFRRVPPLATLATVGLCLTIEIVFHWIFHVPDQRISLSPAKVIYKFQWYRLMTGSLFHLGLFHLLTNMLSAISLGTIVEGRYGTIRQGMNTLLVILYTSLMFLVLAVLFSSTGFIKNMMHRDAVGFSSVLFHFLVMECHLSNNDSFSIPTGAGGGRGITIPSTLVPWILLLVLQLVLPRASFWGHVAGILTGTLQVYGILPMIPSDAYIRGMEEWESLEFLTSSRNFVESPTTIPERFEPAALLQGIQNACSNMTSAIRDMNLLDRANTRIFGSRRRGAHDPNDIDSSTQRGTTATFTLLMDDDDDDDDANPGSDSLESGPITRMV
jgi:membrane associated rhomboid family serine protease